MGYPFEQAKYFSQGRFGRKVNQIFIHTMETPETKKRAWNVLLWFKSPRSPQASAHFMVDATSIFQSVKLTDTAWAVGQWDRNCSSISIETAGEASQTPAQWADAYSQAEIANTAHLVALMCKQFDIPPVKLTPLQVFLRKPGIGGHWDVTLGYKIRGGHTDPGRFYPWEHLIALVREELSKL